MPAVVIRVGGLEELEELYKPSLEEVQAKVAAHQEWLKRSSFVSRGPVSGSCFEVVGWDLRGMSFRGSNLQNAVFARCEMSDSDFSGAHLGSASIMTSNVFGANFRGAKLSQARLFNVDFSRSCFAEADLSAADFYQVKMVECDFTGALMVDTRLDRANLSQARGLLDPIDWIESHLKRNERGFLAYKVFRVRRGPGNFVERECCLFKLPSIWKLEPGSVLTEVVNPHPAVVYGSGIHVGTFEWVKKFCSPCNDAILDPCWSFEVWEVLIEFPWLASVVIPFHTQGEFRVGRVRLLRVVTEDIKAEVEAL